MIDQDASASASRATAAGVAVVLICLILGVGILAASRWYASPPHFDQMQHFASITHCQEPELTDEGRWGRTEFRCSLPAGQGQLIVAFPGEKQSMADFTRTVHGQALFIGDNYMVIGDRGQRDRVLALNLPRTLPQKHHLVAPGEPDRVNTR